MNQRDLIKKSGLSFRQLLSLKNNYLDIKRNRYYKHRKVKPADSLQEYIFDEANGCWEIIFIGIAIILFFTVGEYYKNRIPSEGAQVFIILFILSLIPFFLAMKIHLRTTINTVFKLILLRAIQAIYRVK